MSKPENSETKIVKTICDRCHCGCGVLAYVKEGKVDKVEGDPDFPQNEGMLCPKGLSVTQLLYNPERIQYPMKRTGRRGEGEWQRISWDEALETVASKFREIVDKYGPQAITWSWGDAAFHCSKVTKQVWLQAVGSPLRFHSDAHYCYHPTMIANNVTFGASITSEVGPDYRNSRCMMLWGGNPVMTHPTRAKDIMIAKKKGAKLIVIDPRFTEIASKADIFLQVRPGTDGALALGMINTIINERLYDAEFVEKWCAGFERLKERVQQYPVDRVAEITWVPEDDIVKAARTYATTKPASCHNRLGVQMNLNAVQTLRAIATLVAITANVDIKGGNILPNLPKGFKTLGNLLKEFSLPNEDRAIGAQEYPLLTGSKSLALNPSFGPSIIHAMLTDNPYPVRGLWVLNHLLGALEDSNETREALMRLDFVVGSDFFMTPTMELCDVILPPCTYLERDETEHVFYPNYIAARQKVVEEISETKNERWIDLEIIKRMGLALPKEFRDDKEYNEYVVGGMGLSFEELKTKRVVDEPISYRKYEREGFKTPSGKIELHSTIFEKFDYDPLPSYTEHPETPTSSPELAREYPLILISGGRHVVYWQGANIQLPWLREIVPEPMLEIHPETASNLNIKEGDWVWLETPKGKGRVKLKANLTEAVHQLVVHAPSHWYYPEKTRGDEALEFNINNVLSNDPPYDPICGATPLRGSYFCKVYKVET